MRKLIISIVLFTVLIILGCGEDKKTPEQVQKNTVEKYAEKMVQTNNQASVLSCRASCKLISASLEMYEMDGGNLDKDGDIKSQYLLEEKGIINNFPKCPSDGKYMWSVNNQEVYCTVHGSAKNPK